MALGAQSWVTYAGDDKEALKAIILVRSLKNVFTRMPASIFVSHTVSENFVSLLEDEFERCISMTKSRCEKFQGLNFGSVALINAWNLTNLKKFVFLDCNCLVVKNGDEVFKKVGVHFLSTGMPIVVDNPSVAEFKKFVSVVESGCWDMKKLLEKYPTLDEKYNVGVTLDGSPLIRNIDDIKILQFAYPHPTEMLTNGLVKKANVGLLETRAVSLALELFTADGLSESISKHWKLNMNLEFPSMKVETPKYCENLQDSIAIVGMSFRFPGANNLDEFWELLIKGQDGIIKLPDGRWTDNECIGKVESCSEDQAGFLKCPVDQMDSKFFGLSPAELAYMDPQQRLTLQVTWEALEHAGINPLQLKNSNTGVFGGWWRNDYTQWLDNSSGEDFLRVYMATALGSLAGRISHMLDTTGPCIATESGCSTSIVGVDMACKNLRDETCDLGLAFGVNLLFRNSCIKTMHSVVAPDGHCKTFDASADGFGRAEGCSVLVLKRYPDAVRDGDRIWGLIRGSAMVQEGPSRSLGTPTVHCEALAMKLALENAGVEPKDVSFVETHGTGTPVGDPIEVAAMSEIYSKDRTDILTIGSVKTNIGHTESCAGIAGIIKTLLALKYEMIPPHRNFETLNPEIDLSILPAQIPLTAFPWKKNVNGQPRIAGVSSFGITGTDAHVIIQETPDVRPSSALQLLSSLPLNVLKLSAKSEEALEDMIATYAKFIQEAEEKLSLEDICYTANIGRADFQHRCLITASDKNDLVQKLSKNTIEKKLIPSACPKICFLFTGQGSQYPGMAKSLYENCPTFQMHFDSCCTLLKNEIGIDMKEAMWGNKTSELSRTIYSQTSIFCVEYCLLKLWESWGVKPDIVLGHSLGEFAAAVAAGMLKFEDALKLVAERSRLIDELPRGQMIVLKENKENVEKYMKQFGSTDSLLWLDYAAVNSNDQTVLAGNSDTVQKFKKFCENNQIKAIILEATHAFHSRHMDPMLEEYKNIASNIKYSKSVCTFISGVEGKKLEKVNEDYWVQHTREGVRFIEASQAVLKECGASSPLFLEVGPHPVLSALTMNNSDKSLTCLPSLRKNTEEWSTLLTTLGKLYLSGIEINWQNFHQFSTKKKITLPFYSFQQKHYWYEPKDEVQYPIHPLIGIPLSTPSTQKVFENSIELNNVSYMRDHEIGSKIIFPMAAFIECAMVAGHAAIQCSEGGYFMPNTPLTIQNFSIEGSLGLVENVKTHLQTIVSPDDSGETRATIYSKISLDKKTHKWVRHAGGIFSPYAVKLEEKEMKPESLEVIKSRCTTKCSSDVYAKFRVHGLKLGPLFQTSTDRRTGDDGEICNRVIMNENTDGYILHPIIIDAMIQAIVFADNQDPTCLSVPVSINKFIWYAKLETDVCYVYVDQRGLGSQRTVVLYDDNGQIIARMVGLTLIDTTVSSIMATLEAQKTSLPNMFQDIWREGLGPMDRRRVETGDTIDDSIFSTDYMKSTEHFNILEGNEKNAYDNSNKLCLMYILNGLHDLGWTAVVDQKFKIKDLMLSLYILPKHEGIFRYLLTELVQEGYLKIMNEDVTEFQVVKSVPSKQEVTLFIDSLHKYLDLPNNPEILAVGATGRILGSILTGKTNALPILFPEDTSTVGPAEAYYIESLPSKCSKRLANHIFAEKLFMNQNQTTDNNKHVCRILEVGAGTGSFTKALLPSLKGSQNTSFEYTYTDISPAFFLKGEKLFQDSDINVVYKTLNLELDPLTQGFTPHHYDVIYAAYVVHATKDITESLSHLRNLLRPGGLLILIETVKPHLGINLIFGMLEGYWRFTDTDLRPFNCEMSTDKWHHVLKGLNFNKTVSYDVCEGLGSIFFAQASQDSKYILYSDPTLNKEIKTWILFADDDTFGNELATNIESMGRQVIHVRKSGDGFYKFSDSSYQIRTKSSEDMKFIFETITQQKNSQLEGVVYSWALNNVDSDYSEICQPYLHICQNIVTLNKVKLIAYIKGQVSIGDHDLSQPTSSLILGMTKTLSNESQNNTAKCVVLDLEESSKNRMIQEAVAELFIDDQEVQVAYRNNSRYVCRLNPYKIQNNSLALPRSDRFHLLLPSSNAISDLRFGPMEASNLEEMDIEIKVKAYALNFRDIFAVVKPDKQFETLNSVGIDFAGIVSAIGSGVSDRKVGDFVFGMNLNGNALPSYIKLNTDLVLQMPQNITFNEAATLPTVAATASVCLLQVAKLKASETVLIHTGSGGVGISAIQIAQSLNCNIITTAGSSRKRAYLRNLGIKHVFNSRNTNYEKCILNALGGANVDVVLNSLTSPGFKEASLAVCKSGARFIEMSKLNTWTNEQVKSLRPDVFYEIVDLSSASEPRVKTFLERIRKLLDNSIVKPLPYVGFEASDIREALTYLQKAKHIGKVVCIMPELSSKQGSALHIPMFNDKSTYLITGGLGGIGVEVAKWMTNSGAKHIVLAGRSAPKQHVTQAIQKLNSDGSEIICMELDVGNYDKCRKGLESLKSMGIPPLRGIMHAAGVLSDATFINQTWDKYETVFNAKVKGGWNLHLLTLDYPLEHFIMFSSATAKLGPIGLGNHSSANVYLDALAAYRNSIGLPSTTINWGQWGQVGVAANIEMTGLKPFTALQGISALERIMKTQQLQTIVLEADLRVLKEFFPSCRKYLEELKYEEDDTKVFKLTVGSDEFWAEYDSSPKKFETAKKYTDLMIRPILKIDEPIGDNANFQEMGLDSLMMIELKNSLQTLLGDRAQVSMNSVKDCNTLVQLATRIVELAKGIQDIAPPTQDELSQLVRQDSQLPLEISPQGSVCKPSEIRTVLITGVSGNLGPYILREISKRPQIQKIYCLMRPNTKVSGQDRLFKMLDDKKLSSEIRLDIVECVTGSITEAKLGLSEENFTKLSKQVDAIFHLAVKSDHLDIYRVARGSNTDIRTVNVLGTINVLEFACSSNKPKHVYHASTLAAVAKLDEDKTVTEDWPLVGDIDGMPNYGYPISKFIGDLLMAQAVERGLPCKVFRIPNIGGDSKTGGNVSALDNLLMIRFMAYLHLGIIPTANWTYPLMLIPVDICAELSSQIFFDDKAGNEVYNVFNPHANNEQDFVNIAGEFGSSIKIVEPQVFVKTILDMEDSELLFALKRSSEGDEVSREYLKQNVGWMSNPPGVFWSKKLQKLIPNYADRMGTSLDILKRDLKCAKESGVFAKLGLK